jgi:FkbM family methyltransferase
MELKRTFSRAMNKSLPELASAIAYRIKRARYRPNIIVTPTSDQIVTLGFGSYGAWSFADTRQLIGSTIISCGLGEDASFDVAFARKYRAKVIIMDPTPRAICHFNDLIARIGLPATKPFAVSGPQPVEAYDLVGLRREQFELIPKAVWSRSQLLKFYCPPNPKNVSHSIVNFQNRHRQDTEYIEVEATTLKEVMRHYALNDLPLLKMDIEGAEALVIADMLDSGIFPNQLLVDYDELSLPSDDSKRRIEGTHQALMAGGYRAICRSYENFSYIRS